MWEEHREHLGTSGNIQSPSHLSHSICLVTCAWPKVTQPVEEEKMGFEGRPS